MRYASIKNNRIYVISSELLNNGIQGIEIPKELDHVDSKELIINGKFRDGKIVCRTAKKPASHLKIALISNWKMPCGLASYMSHLWAAVTPHIGDWKMFIEKNANMSGVLNQVGDQIVPTNKIVPCWNRGESLKELVSAIKKYDPDIVWINHEFGLFPNAGYWLSMLCQLSDYRVIVTMHSVFHHRDKTIVEAAIPEIVVHLEGARSVLKHDKKVPGKVYIIPHGCSSYEPDKLWNFYKTEHTILQAGFLLRYKGWENSLRAVAILRNKYPDIFFTGICSESPHNIVEHHIYYQELLQLIEELDVQENIALIRGFQSDESLDSYMRTNQISLFPYVSSPEHEVFGVSGAARLAMSKGLPVVSSNVNHFSDLPTIKANTPEEMADAIDKLFSDSIARQTQLQKQIDYINENTWEKVGLRYISLFENR